MTIKEYLENNNLSYLCGSKNILSPSGYIIGSNKNLIKEKIEKITQSKI